MIDLPPLPPLEIVQIWEEKEPTDWLVSSWDAGQSSINRWTSDNVVSTEDGGVEIILHANETGKGRAFDGGEIQHGIKASYGTWGWTAKAPEMIDGTVFGMFLYKADWKNDPWLEYDFEFVGEDTTKVQLNVHMEDANGQHITLKEPAIIDLGFDAADAEHLYEITVKPDHVIFEIDDMEVARFDADDMPGNVWYSGSLRSFVDLWAAPPSMEGWTGKLDYKGEPLVATVSGAGYYSKAERSSADYGTAVSADQPIQLAQISDKRDSDDFLISSWDAGQSSSTTWGADNVRKTTSGDVELVLDGNTGEGRPFVGGEIQSTAKAVAGTWSWEAKAPKMKPGAVFGIFLYKADWQHDPVIEYDFEFVGADTRRVQINVHMDDANGKRVSLLDPPVIDLGFDASEAMHLYEIVVAPGKATFLVDGKEIASLGPKDMPNRAWRVGQLRSFVDLWAVSGGQTNWAGEFKYDGEPLVATVKSIGIRPGDF
jgi:hypothetical protein